MEIFVRGPDNAIWTNWETSPSSTTWAFWYSFGGYLLGEPEVDYAVDGRMEIFARAGDNAVWTRWQTSPDGAWAGWYQMGGGWTGNPSAFQVSDGRMEYFARVSDGTLWTQYQPLVNGNWSSFYSFGKPGSGVSAVGDPTTGLGINRVNSGLPAAIFIRGSDSHVWYRTEVGANADWTGWLVLGGTLAP
jgi:hypothetical protein